MLVDEVEISPLLLDPNFCHFFSHGTVTSSRYGVRFLHPHITDIRRRSRPQLGANPHGCQELSQSRQGRPNGQFTRFGIGG